MPQTTVLVADDDADLRDILRSILEPKGFRVLEAPDGQQALDLIRVQRPQLLILDYVMPRLDGPHLCQLLKQDLLLRHVPIIMLTGRGDVDDKVHGMEVGVDDYLVKPFEPKELLARVNMVLRRTEQELEANPLTKLPGNVSIQKDIDARLATRQPVAVCYCDLNRFKAFNDHYGFERGDRAIELTARVLMNAVRHHGRPADFIGHIGGDDFVIVTSPECVETLCDYIITEFDAQAPGLYDVEDRQRGYLLHTDRKGKAEQVKLLSIAIAIVTNAERSLQHLGEIAKIGAELKAYAKQFEKSMYVTERRKPSAS